MSCPDLLLLSQLLDRELPEPEAASLRSHVDGCTSCRARSDRLRRLVAAAATDARAISAGGSGAMTDDTASETRGDGCLSPSRIAAWLDSGAAAQERESASRHLEGCPSCVASVLAAKRILLRLDASPHRPVPEALRARVASRWPEPVPASVAAAPRLSEIVLRVTRAAASLLERRLVEPLRELVELPEPLAAVRSAEAGALCFELHATAARLRLTVVPAGEAVGLVLVLESEAGALLPDQRVYLRRHGRAIYSARTDEHGAVTMPGLERGVFEVSCPGVGAAFRLDLRE